ncbi:MAG: RIP metalloprotease RseP [Muribaculaceae bacterium]|nr:RIP metalloprotease RseP [Muribaculaceae bacterium]
MDTFLIKAAQLILALAFLIIVHEFGHFLFARIFGVKVEKFYIFFDPWKELFKWKPKKYYGFFGTHHNINKNDNTESSVTDDGNTVPLINSNGKDSIKDRTDKTKKKSSFWGDTEYGIGWIPLGGYCKIAGMIDESMDTEQLKGEPQEWEFRSKPAWQRLLIMIGGVLFNFLLAILIYAGIVFATGEKYVPFKNATDGMAYSPAAKEIGFKDGDIPLSADDKDLDYPSESIMDMMQAKEVKVLRDHKDTVVIPIPEKFIFTLEDEAKNKKSEFSFLTYRIPVEISQVMPGEGASKAGIEEGDRILAVNSVATPSLLEFHEVLEAQGEASKKTQHSQNATVNFKIARKSTDGHHDTIQIPVRLSENNKMGVGLEVDITKFYEAKEKKYNIFTAIPRGVTMGTDRLTSYAKSMKLVATKEGAKSIGGFGSIGSIFPEKWDWIAFWNIAAFLSVALAFMNILPIPALDGGHVLFLLYEIIFRRKPSQKFMEYAQMAGMIFLVLLLLYANGMDIVRLFK